MERMNKEQMEKLEAYFKAREKTGGISNDEIRKYAKREFGIILSKSYIPDLRTRLKNGKDKGPSVTLIENKVPDRDRLYTIDELIPSSDKWNPPFCAFNKDQEVTLELYLSTDKHFIENKVLETPFDKVYDSILSGVA